MIFTESLKTFTTLSPYLKKHPPSGKPQIALKEIPFAWAALSHQRLPPVPKPTAPRAPRGEVGTRCLPQLGRGSQGLPQHEELLSSTAGLALGGELVPLVKLCRSHRSKKAAQELGRASLASSPPRFPPSTACIASAQAPS